MKNGSRLARDLLLFAIFIVALNVSLKWTKQYTSFKNLRSMVTGHAADDSWRPMLPALAVANAGGRGLYSKVFFEQHIKYIDPPTAMLLPWAVQLVQPQITKTQMIQELNLVGWIATWCLIAISIVILIDPIRKEKTEPDFVSRHTKVISAVAAFVLAIFYYPATLGMAIGQAVTSVSLFFALALWAWLRGSKSFAGVAIAIAALIKPTFLLFLIWGALRRERAFCVAFSCTFAAALVASILIFGFQAHLEYLSVLNYVGQRGEAFYANQSVNGLLNRLLQPAEFRTWFLDAYPPYNPFIHAATAFTAILVIGLALFLPRASTKGSALDFGGMLLAVILASPIAWETSYGPLLPIYSMLLHLPSVSRRMLAISYVLVANAFSMLMNVTNPPWNLVQSYVFFGGVMCAAIVYRALRKKDSQAALIYTQGTALNA